MKRYMALLFRPQRSGKWKFDFGIGTIQDTPKGRTAKIRHIGQSRAAAALCLLAGYISFKTLVCSTAKYIWDKRQGF